MMSKQLVKLSLLALVLSWLLLFFSGCDTQKRFSKLADEHKDWLAEECIEHYPAKDSLIQGKTDTVTNTITRTDSVITTVRDTITGKTRTIKLPCPPCVQATKTVLRTDTIVRVDRAKEAVLINQYKAEHDKLVKTEEKLDNRTTQRNWWIIATLILAAGHAIRWFIKR